MKLTRRSVLALLPSAPSALRALAAPRATPVSKLYIGTYTNPADSAPGAKGIYTCTWNASEGTLGALELIAATPNPAFLALSPTDPHQLFAVNETGTPNDTVTAFTSSPGTSQLRKLNSVRTGSSGPCHLALDHTGRALFVANYAGGSLSSYQVSSNGLSEAVSILRFSGHGIAPQQNAAHTHCILLSPDNRFLLVNDLGLDRIMVFHIDPATARLTPAATPFYTATLGSGPRHATFHPGGRWVYSVNELNSTIDQLAWSSTDGTLIHKTTISTLPIEIQALHQTNAPAELAIDASGQFLYVSNRFHDSIGVFSIDSATGALAPVQDIPCGGKTPRHFALDPTGRWVLVANQDSRNIIVFERDQTTGKLTPTGRSYILNSPVCILFA